MTQLMDLLVGTSSQKPSPEVNSAGGNGIEDNENREAFSNLFSSTTPQSQTDQSSTDALPAETSELAQEPLALLPDQDALLIDPQDGETITTIGANPSEVDGEILPSLNLTGLSIAEEVETAPGLVENTTINQSGSSNKRELINAIATGTLQQASPSNGQLYAEATASTSIEALTKGAISAVTEGRPAEIGRRDVDPTQNIQIDAEVEIDHEQLVARANSKLSATSPINMALNNIAPLEPTSAPVTGIAENSTFTTSTGSTGSIITPQNAPQIGQLVVSQIGQALANITVTGDRLEVRLDPPELGRVYIDFNYDGDRIVAATVSAEQTDTTSLMRKNAESLLKQLSAAGFEGVELSFAEHSDQRFTEQEEGGATNVAYADEVELAISSRPVDQVRPSLLQLGEDGIDMRL